MGLLEFERDYLNKIEKTKSRLDKAETNKKVLEEKKVRN